MFFLGTPRFHATRFAAIVELISAIILNVAPMQGVIGHLHAQIENFGAKMEFHKKHRRPVPTNAPLEKHSKEVTHQDLVGLLVILASQIQKSVT